MRLPIKDKEIIELYKAGYSQNDIVEKYDVSVVYTRSVLNAAGFDTRGFRTLRPSAMKVIEVLVGAGIRYIDIEEICDLSFHAIRDYVNRAGCRPKKKASSYGEASFSHTDEFLDAYRKGNSFCFLVENMSLQDCDILPVFRSITKEDVQMHRKGLRLLIKQYKEDGLSNAGITRILNISRSIVRNGIK